MPAAAGQRCDRGVHRQADHKRNTEQRQRQHLRTAARKLGSARDSPSHRIARRHARHLSEAADPAARRKRCKAATHRFGRYETTARKRQSAAMMWQICRRNERRQPLAATEKSAQQQRSYLCSMYSGIRRCSRRAEPKIDHAADHQHPGPDVDVDAELEAVAEPACQYDLRDERQHRAGHANKKRGAGEPPRQRESRCRRSGRCVPTQ